MPYKDGVPYAPGSDTSKAAAKSMQKQAVLQRAMLCVYLEKCGTKGATKDQMHNATKMATNSIAPRTRELEAEGTIVKLTETRLTRAKRDAYVYVLHKYVNGRNFIPYVRYILVCEDEFRKILYDVDDAWVTSRWKALEHGVVYDDGSG